MPATDPVWRPTWPTLAVIAAVGGLGCGFEPTGQVQLAVGGNASIDRYEIRIFGQALTCAAFDQNPTQYRTISQCTPAEIDTSVQCHIEMAIVDTGPVRITPIPIGTRTITILGFSGQTLSEIGCADQVQVVDGQAAQVTIAMQAAP